MTEYIDHAAKARKLLARYENASLHIIEATAAQAHATMALAEQQRIANLIALMSSDEGAYVINGNSHSYKPDNWEPIRREIRVALGLEESND